MDQHPIPQDVTGFQFKLVGAMTVKQFGYVACGVVTAVIFYYLPLHSIFGILLKVLLIPLSGASGAIIAFVPIDGRPIDVMATNFVKAVFSPNQYIYHREGKQLSFTTVAIAKTPATKKTQQETQTRTSSFTSPGQLNQKEEKLRALLLSSRGEMKNDIDKKEAAFLKTLTFSPAAPSINRPAVIPQHAAPITKPPQLAQTPQSQLQAAPSPVKPSPLVSPSPQLSQPSISNNNNNTNALSKKESEVEQKLTQAEQGDSVSTTPTTHIATQQKVTTLSQQIQEIHTQKQQLEQELSHLKNQLATQKGQPMPTPAIPKGVTATQPLQDPQHVRAIPQGVTKKVGLPHVSDSPNVVVGIVKDPRGNVLPHILVEVKDKDGNPVRAFKTNQLGQFASATPLSPGTYTIELEDPKNQQRFDVIQITANNQILLPIEIISHDAREELRKQLFAS